MGVIHVSHMTSGVSAAGARWQTAKQNNAETYIYYVLVSPVPAGR